MNYSIESTDLESSRGGVAAASAKRFYEAEQTRLESKRQITR